MMLIGDFKVASLHANTCIANKQRLGRCDVSLNVNP